MDIDPMQRENPFDIENRENDGENFPMEERQQQDYESDNHFNDGDTAETSFTTPLNTTKDIDNIINTIENLGLHERMRDAMKEIELGDSIDKQVKLVFTKGIEKSRLLDNLDTKYWDGFILDDEQKKFHWEQKLNNLNSALAKLERKDVLYIDGSNKKVYDFVDTNVRESTTTKRGDINGYYYGSKKILSRNRKKEFYAEEGPKLEEFLLRLELIQNDSARSIFVNYTNMDISPETSALEYIKGLRDEQHEIAESIEMKDMKDLQGKVREINKIESNISDIRKNKRIAIRLKTIRKTLVEHLARLGRFIRTHKVKFGFLTLSLAIGLSSTAIGIVETKHAIDAGVAKGKEIVEKLTSTLVKTITFVANLNGKTVQQGLGYFTAFATSLSGFIYWIYSGSFYSLFGGLITMMMSILYISSTFSYPIDSIIDTIDATELQLEETSYTSIGKKPPEKVIEEIAEKTELPVEEVEKKIEEKIKDIKPNPVRYFYAYSASAAAKTIKTSKKVVKKSIWVIEHSTYIIMGLVILALLVLLR